MNDTAALSQVCSGIFIHLIGMVQPPGIGMPSDNAFSHFCKKLAV